MRLLRRTLDDRYPNQRADVQVARITSEGAGQFEPAGTWFPAGINTYMYPYT
jgi:hypothetical protein